MADISLGPGAEEVPLAGMLAEMLKANLEKPEKKRDFEKLKAKVLIHAVDAEAKITMDFDRGRLTVYGGEAGKPDIAIATDSTTLLELANLKIKYGMPWYFDETGLGVVRKLLKGDLKIKGMFTHLGALTRLTKIMSLS
ncbi:MAG: SCP2 sterol-binding domain-containing protein [Actinobacteria bacterium]|nr:SCP2 sterol-binding domain-containing protein [Actinomycetota bacterium]